MKKFFFALICLMGAVMVRAQVTTVPAFPVDSAGNVTITFNAAQGNQGLMGYTGDVYIHTGVVLQGTSGWSNVVTTWGVANNAWKMTPLGNNQYSYTITNIRGWYGVTAGQVIDSLAMVFRDAGGNTVGRATGGGDIYVKVVQPGGLSAQFSVPAQKPYFKQQAQTLNTTFTCSQAATVSIYEDNVLKSTTANTTTVNTSFTGTPGVHWVKGVAVRNAIAVTDSFYYVNIPATAIAALPAGAHDGVNYNSNGSVTLVLVAPHKNNVCVVGEFNNWVADTAYFMKNTPDSSRWWITLSGLSSPHQYAYQYIADGSIKVADPYTNLVLDPDNDQYIPASVYPNLKAYPTGKTTGIVSVLETGKTPYNWTATGYQKPDKSNLVIYELLVRDFVYTHSYQQLKDTIAYLKRLGINAIELMPVNEFEGNISWGYNPSFYFAPDKYYGTADALKAFIDACHAENIAVIMDMVLNHSFEQSPMCQLYWDATNGWPATNNPWFNSDCNPSVPGYQGKHPYGVGYDINHESPYTRKFVSDVVHYWVSEFKIDGYRFDLSKGFTQKYTGDSVAAWGAYDSSRVAIWKAYTDSIRALDTSTYIILEHFADNSEETVLANYGMMPWGNMAYAYQQDGMGYPASGGDVSGVSYQQRGWSKPNLVGYMESHDEERVMYKCEQYGASSGNYNIKNINTGLDRIKLNATFFFTVPGPKMIWQFGELGYDSSINSGGGRTDPKAMLWQYYSDPVRGALYQHFRSLINLKVQYPQAMNTTQYTMSTGSTALRSIYLNDTSMQVTVLGNFGTSAASISAAFQHTGWWYNFFTGDSLNVTSTPMSVNLQAGEYRLYLSKRTALSLNTTAVNETNKEAGKVQLFQNYPNPFANTSTVAFYLPAKDKVRLEMRDITGKLVDVIADANFNPGSYTFDLTGSKLGAGIYFISLTTANGARETIKINVLK
ncbi:alpha-amylase family glycosyl hydrolase [Chitinophagaceae bacterium MMS25-I14]